MCDVADSYVSVSFIYIFLTRICMCDLTRLLVRDVTRLYVCDVADSNVSVYMLSMYSYTYV